jgi:hypothetical protein
MALDPNSQKFVDDFFSAIAPFDAAYQRIGFSYLALKLDERFVMIRGRLFLNTSAPKSPTLQFQSHRVRAGHYTLPELGLGVPELVGRLIAGRLDTPKANYIFQQRREVITRQPSCPSTQKGLRPSFGSQAELETALNRLISAPASCSARA